MFKYFVNIAIVLYCSTIHSSYSSLIGRYRGTILAEPAAVLKNLRIPSYPRLSIRGRPDNPDPNNDCPRRCCRCPLLALTPGEFTSPTMPSSDNNDESYRESEIGDATTLKKEEENPTGVSKHFFSKKRRSDVQLSKDGVANDSDGSGEDDDDNQNCEGGKRSDPFKRAPDDVLKNRKIVRVSSKWSGGKNGGTEVGGTFASIKLTHASPAKKLAETESSTKGSNSVLGEPGGTTAKSGALFGSGFGNESNGFGSLNSSSSSANAEFCSGEPNPSASKPMPFGVGFGSVSSGFGSLKSFSTESGFGSASQPKSSPSIEFATTTSNNSSLTERIANPSTVYQSQFPTASVVDIDNGEQEEDCLCQVRAKLFRMVQEVESADDDGESKPKGDVPSVPSTTGRMESVTNQKLTQDESTEAEKEGDSTSGRGEGGNKPNLVQKEAGIGPVRILKRKPPNIHGKDGEKTHAEQQSTVRVVQRQETSGGGTTRVILNIRLDKKTCTVIRRGDKFVQLNAPKSCGAVESSLFKVKTTVEADTLENTLTNVLGLNGEDV